MLRNLWCQDLNKSPRVLRWDLPCALSKKGVQPTQRINIWNMVKNRMFPSGPKHIRADNLQYYISFASQNYHWRFCTCSGWLVVRLCWSLGLWSVEVFGNGRTAKIFSQTVPSSQPTNQPKGQEQHLEPNLGIPWHTCSLQNWIRRYADPTDWWSVAVLHLIVLSGSTSSGQ